MTNIRTLAICALVFGVIGVALGIAVMTLHFTDTNDDHGTTSRTDGSTESREVATNPTEPFGWQPTEQRSLGEQHEVLFVDKFMVGKEPGLVFSTIPAAIEKAQNSTYPVSILVRHGTYVEPFTLPDQVSLRGFSKETTIISGDVLISGGSHSIESITFHQPLVTRKNTQCNIRGCDLHGLSLGEANDLTLSLKTHLTGTVTTPNTMDPEVGGRLTLMDCVMSACTINITANMKFSCLRLSNFEEEDNSVLNLQPVAYTRSGTSGIRLISSQIHSIVCQTTSMWSSDSNVLIQSCNLDEMTIRGEGTDHGISIINCTMDRCVVEACNQVLASASFLGELLQTGGIFFGEAITCHKCNIEEQASFKASSCGMSGSLGNVYLSTSGVVSFRGEVDNVVIEGDGRYSFLSCGMTGLQILPCNPIQVEVQNSCIKTMIHCCAQSGELQISCTKVGGMATDTDEWVSLHVSEGMELDFDTVRFDGSVMVTNAPETKISHLFTHCTFMKDVSILTLSEKKAAAEQPHRFDFLRCTFGETFQVDNPCVLLGLQGCTLRDDLQLVQIGQMFTMSHTDYRTLSFGEDISARDVRVYVDACVGGSGEHNLVVRTREPFAVFEVNNSFVGDLVFAGTVAAPEGKFRISGCRLNGEIKTHAAAATTLIFSSCVLNEPYEITDAMVVVSASNNSTIDQRTPFVGDTAPQVQA